MLRTRRRIPNPASPRLGFKLALLALRWMGLGEDSVVVGDAIAIAVGVLSGGRYPVVRIRKTVCLSRDALSSSWSFERSSLTPFFTL